MNKNISLLKKAEDPKAYAKLASQGTLLGYPVKIQGQSHRSDNNIPYHSSIKFFDPKDHVHAIHQIAQHLPLNPPDARNTQIEPGQVKDRLGNDVFILKLKGNSAEKLKEHHAKFSHMGNPDGYVYEAHISVPKDVHDKVKASGAKTAHEAGIEFGNAELRQGPKTLKTYRHESDSAEPKVPDQGDMTAKMAVPKTDFNKSEHRLEKGILRTAGTALGMAGALAGAAPISNAANRSPANIQHAKPQVTQYDHQKMLRTLAQVESSGGKNTKHGEGGGPIHGHEHAYGVYGLMPETIRETIQGHKDLKTKHGKALALRGQQLHHYMKDNPDLENVIADRHLSHMEHRLGKDPGQLGYAWLMGTQGTLNDRKRGTDIKNHWRTKRVEDAYGKGK